MRPGARIAGRWEVTAAVPGEPTVGRWRAVDAATGEPAEVLVLQPGTDGGPARAAFLDAHRAVSRAGDPGVVAVYAVAEHEHEALVVRAPLEDATLADVRGPLPAGQVAAAAVRLLPAVLAANGACRGALTESDIGLTAHGHPVFAPRCRPAAGVMAGDARWVAPEVLAGAPPSAASDLYGLGVALYRLAAGRPPVGDPPVPAGSFTPDFPPELDQALAALLSRDPAQRAGALPLLQQVATPMSDLRTRAPSRATLVTGDVKLTATAAEPLGGRPDVARPRAGLQIAGRRLQELDPSGRSAAAGFGNISVDEVDRLGASGLPLPLEAHAKAISASARAAALARDTGLPVEVVTPPAWRWPLLALVMALVTMVAVTLGVVLAPVLLAVAAVASLVGIGAVIAWVGQAARWSRFLSARRRLASRAPPEPVATRQARVSALRRALPGAELPVAVEADVRAALKGVERHLVELQRIADAVRGVLDASDAPALRTRLGALAGLAATDPTAAAERDRLARTLSDLEAVQRRRQRLEPELAEVDEALDDLAGVLGRFGTGSETSAVDTLRRTSRLAREALAEDDARPPPDRDPERS